ncbi:NmrA-like family domain-containing protein [Lachnellula suecica]|uniref:NmrA-like family domain-containing protein n=1 Tax=Lachnellula suecica TaxID=602035 RepID=A0A8T9CK44_9HELO|nr:NmrA-like family domain-containing protein [Lachnellula suecica]
MSSEKPLLVVLGSTGNQGGSVLSHFLSLSPSPYALRGVTRNPSSPKSLSLASLGVEMVVGDFDDVSSLDAAFQGAAVIFSVTDYWQSYTNPLVRERVSISGQGLGLASRDNEAQQNKNIIDAAAKISTLERFVLSSLPNTKELSGGKYSHIYHYDGKAIAEENGRSTYPELWAKTNVFYAGYYLENYWDSRGSLFRPKLNKGKDTLVLSVADPLATAPLPMYSAVGDTGPLVEALIRAEAGKKIIGVNESLGYRDFANILGQVLGKSVEFVDGNPSFDMGDPEITKDMEEMMGFCVDFGLHGEKVDKSVLSPVDLGVPVHLASVKEWCGKQDWEKLLETA